jgi:ribosomal protein S18 acetylase RimI-like enzyme
MSQEKIISPEKFETRRITSADWEKFKELRLKALQTDPQAFGGTYESESSYDEGYWKILLDNPERCFFAVENQNSFIATGGAKKIKDRDSAYAIIGVYTDLKFRGRGISSGILLEIEAEVKNRGAKDLELWVNADQEQAVSAYKKAGFTLSKTLKDEKLGDGNMHDVFVMNKKL